MLSSRWNSAARRVLSRQNPYNSAWKTASVTPHIRSSIRLSSTQKDLFLQRHLGVYDEKQRQEMLQFIGFDSIESLIDTIVPPEIRLKHEMRLSEPMAEHQALEKLHQIAQKNEMLRSFIGQGYHECITPAVIQRNMLENPGWYTAYTPYQAEISQGRLEMLLNFQTMVQDLTGLEFSNASLLDEATAAAEAMTLSHGAANGKRNSFFVAEDCHPQSIGVMQTRALNVGIDLVVGDPIKQLMQVPKDRLKSFSGVLLQYPNTYGSVKDYRQFVEKAHENKLVVSMAVDLLALTQVISPGELGADIAIGSAQRFGVPMMFGGPHAAFMATSKAYHRKLPGRIIGVSKDSQGNRALRMAMQTREQHIRRDKATSNICTAQALLANMAAAYAIYHGPEGLHRIAKKIQFFASVLVEGIHTHTTCKIRNESAYFDTLDIDLREEASVVMSRAAEKKINLRQIESNRVGVSFGERVEAVDVQKILYALSGKHIALKNIEKLHPQAPQQSIPSELQRRSPYLQHDVFRKYRSETEMMRYLKRLEDKDLGLNRSMISLGSCTMKLNAASELQPVSWPQFMNMHPFVPESQASGYLEMIRSLNSTLAEITGFSAMSTQPNSGAQGEYAGLLAIREYQRANGQGHRNVCLIPMSAHGTNPASAVMAGMKVVVIQSDDNGNIDRHDLEMKANKHADELSALMITYPSTYGVFEQGVKDICALIHSHGGQVYMDGANMNAQVGLCNPKSIGADVCHLNLHKTFCIPHGGGGPGVGTIGVAAHLAPFLPGHQVVPCSGEGQHVVKKSLGAISAAPFGSAGILPISWMYINMLGASGLTQATSNAILNANYMAKKLEAHYEVLYKDPNGLCAHEFIIDIRPFKAHGITEEDIAKRLQDFGFHSPTMSWPVAGTLMIEPTESESLPEMNRLCDAMIAIRQEIRDIASGKINVEDSPLRHAPHTIAVVASEQWDRKYTRQQAALPAKWQQKGANKSYWPTVGRIDNVFGDRNLICSCPLLEEYLD
uniref:Glycine cleavage system P protein n=1 Tax=Albugo laibachii Nc14 TaxID=890382 RepID=F0WGG8_9STRA|nr:unnamed protein product [Albugo laibachii Nc14]|eukprot:CCA20331.1 unnamed protein product [Albugo laibachii Nc14]